MAGRRRAGSQEYADLSGEDKATGASANEDLGSGHQVGKVSQGMPASIAASEWGH
jgi:hypothetical protein